MAVTIKIGLENSSMGISTQVDDVDSVIQSIQEAMEGTSKIVEFIDDKKQKYLLNGAKITYVQIAQEHERRVGFVS